MQQAQSTDHHDSVGRPSLSDAASIPSLTHTEAAEMAAVELERFLTLVESLSPADWDKPTTCTLWNVRQVVAHVTGAAASYARWSEFKRQNSFFVWHDLLDLQQRVPVCSLYGTLRNRAACRRPIEGRSQSLPRRIAQP